MLCVKIFNNINSQSIVLKLFEAYIFFLAHNYFFPSSHSALISSCNVDCACSTSYAPVCGADGAVYFSACHAGCARRTLAGAAQLFHNCACIHSNHTLPVYDYQGKMREVLVGRWVVAANGVALATYFRRAQIRRRCNYTF